MFSEPILFICSYLRLTGRVSEEISVAVLLMCHRKHTSAILIL